MNVKKRPLKAKHIFMLTIAALAFTACDDEKEEYPVPVDASYTIPTDYEFTVDRNAFCGFGMHASETCQPILGRHNHTDF